MNKTILFSSIGALVVASSIGGFLLLNKDPKEKFFDLERKNLVSYMETYDTYLSSGKDIQNDLYDHPFSTQNTFNLTFNPNKKIADSSNIPFDTLKKAAKEINDSRISLHSEIDFKNNLMNNQLDLIQKKIPILSVDTKISDKEINIKSKALKAKSISFKNSKFGKIYSVLNDEEEYSEEVLNLKPIFEELSKSFSKESNEEINENINYYYKQIYEAFPKEKFVKKDNKITLSLSNKDFANIFVPTLEEIKNDKLFLDSYTRSASLDYEVFGEISGYGKKEVEESEKELKKQYQKYVDGIIKELNKMKKSKDKYNLTYTINYDGKKIEKRNITFKKVEKIKEINIKTKKKQGTVTKKSYTEIETVNNDNKGFIKLSSVSENYPGKSVKKLSYTKKEKDDSSKYTYRLDVKDGTEKESIKNIVLNLKNKDNVASAKLTMPIELEKNDNSILEVSIKNKKSKEKIDQNLNVLFKKGDLSLGFNLDTRTKLIKKVEPFKEKKKERHETLHKMKDEDLKNLFEENLYSEIELKKFNSHYKNTTKSVEDFISSLFGFGGLQQMEFEIDQDISIK